MNLGFAGRVGNREGLTRSGPPSGGPDRSIRKNNVPSGSGPSGLHYGRNGDVLTGVDGTGPRTGDWPRPTATVTAVVDSGNIDVEMMFREIWELLLALLLVKSYFDSVVCDHTGSQNATRRAEGQWMAQYIFWVKTQVVHGVYNGSSARAGSEAPGRERRRPAAGRRPVPSTGQNTGSLWPCSSCT